MCIISSGGQVISAFGGAQEIEETAGEFVHDDDVAATQFGKKARTSRRMVQARRDKARCDKAGLVQRAVMRFKRIHKARAQPLARAEEPAPEAAPGSFAGWPPLSSGG